MKYHTVVAAFPEQSIEALYHHRRLNQSGNEKCTKEELVKVIRGELEYHNALGDEWWNNVEQVVDTVATALY